MKQATWCVPGNLGSAECEVIADKSDIPDWSGKTPSPVFLSCFLWNDTHGCSHIAFGHELLQCFMVFTTLLIRISTRIKPGKNTLLSSCFVKHTGSFSFFWAMNSKQCCDPKCIYKCDCIAGCGRLWTCSNILAVFTSCILWIKNEKTWTVKESRAKQSK